MRARVRLKSMGECLLDRRLQWFGHLKRMEENAWSTKYRTFKVSGSFLRGRPKKTWNGAISNDMKERKVNQDITKDRNASKSLIRNRSTHARMEK